MVKNKLMKETMLYLTAHRIDGRLIVKPKAEKILNEGAAIPQTTFKNITFVQVKRFVIKSPKSSAIQIKDCMCCSSWITMTQANKLLAAQRDFYDLIMIQVLF